VRFGLSAGRPSRRDENIRVNQHGNAAARFLSASCSASPNAADANEVAVGNHGQMPHAVIQPTSHTGKLKPLRFAVVGNDAADVNNDAADGKVRRSSAG
jgi:hypothetical protein